MALTVCRRVLHIGLRAGALALACGLGGPLLPVRAQQSGRVPAPELVGGPWINTPGNKPVTLASRRGKVVILHFWTFG